MGYTQCEYGTDHSMWWHVLVASVMTLAMPCSAAMYHGSTAHSVGWMSSCTSCGIILSECGVLSVVGTELHQCILTCHTGEGMHGCTKHATVTPHHPTTTVQDGLVVEMVSRVTAGTEASVHHTPRRTVACHHATGTVSGVDALKAQCMQ